MPLTSVSVCTGLGKVRCLQITQGCICHQPLFQVQGLSKVSPQNVFSTFCLSVLLVNAEVACADLSPVSAFYRVMFLL